MKKIDAKGLSHQELNRMVKDSFKSGEQEIYLKNVMGQRYIGDGLSGRHRLVIDGIPGNDMAAYMDGVEIVVRGNAQDGMGNTMNNGTIVVNGSAGDTAGYAMRGGEIFVKGNVGYRVGIHMKEYMDKRPAIVIGGKAGDFFGEYMSGGVMVLLGLGLKDEEELVGNFCGTGMHGGAIYIRGGVKEHKLGREVRLVEADAQDMEVIAGYVEKFCGHFSANFESIMSKGFAKLYAFNKRPYGNMYAC